MSIQEIESQALQLPPAQRAALAQHLIASLDATDEVGQAWADEATRRSDDIESGTARAIPAADVFAEARRAIL